MAVFDRTARDVTGNRMRGELTEEEKASVGGMMLHQLSHWAPIYI